MTATLDTLPVDAITALARKYGLRELAVFGSVARGEAGPESDIDFLYVPGPETPLDWSLFQVADELERLLGRRVDLVPKEHLHWVIRDRVLAEARPVYAA